MSAPYGELVVVLGDAHVGQRASDIPDKFKKMLTPDKMQHLVSTGNLCARETFEFFRSVAPSMHAVRGDMDEYSSGMTTTEEIVFEVGEFRIGVCHGHQIVPWGEKEALALVARRLDVDILITGHTHVCEAFEVEGTWFVNPGSITGAYTPLRDNVKPSFVLLSIQANTVKLYMYELNPVSGEVDIHRARFNKPSKNPFASSSIPSLQASTTAPVLESSHSKSFSAALPTKQIVQPPSASQQNQQQQPASAPKTVNATAPAIPKRPQQSAVTTSTPASAGTKPKSPSVMEPTLESPPVQKRAPPPRPSAEEEIEEMGASNVTQASPTGSSAIPAVSLESSGVETGDVMSSRLNTDIGRKIDQELNLANSDVFADLSFHPPPDENPVPTKLDAASIFEGTNPQLLPPPSTEGHMDDLEVQTEPVTDLPIEGESIQAAEEHWDDV